VFFGTTNQSTANKDTPNRQALLVGDVSERVDDKRLYWPAQNLSVIALSRFAARISWSGASSNP